MNVKMYASEISDLCDYLEEFGQDPKAIVAAVQSFGHAKAGALIAEQIKELPERFAHETVLALKHMGWNSGIPVSLSGSLSLEDDPK